MHEFIEAHLPLTPPETTAYFPVAPVTTTNADFSEYLQGLPKSGDVIEGYHIEELLHIGEMTAVFRGRSCTSSARVSILICRPSTSPSYRRSFELSRNLQARIENAAIARILGGSLFDHELPVTIRQYFIGKKLSSYLRTGRIFPSRVVLSILFPLVEALAEIADFVEEIRWAENFSRCLWCITPDDIIMTQNDGMKLPTHGISHLFDVRIAAQKEGTAVPRYSPSMDCSTILYSLGVLTGLLCREELYDSSESNVLKKNPLRRSLIVLGMRSRGSTSGEGRKFDSLFTLLEELRLLVKQYGVSDFKAAIAGYFHNDIIGHTLS